MLGIWPVVPVLAGLVVIAVNPPAAPVDENPPQFVESTTADQVKFFTSLLLAAGLTVAWAAVELGCERIKEGR